jgi:hypothetical protein
MLRGDQNAPKSGPGTTPSLNLSLQDLVGNQAVQRLLENKTPVIGLDESTRRALQRALHPQGIWHTQALQRITPEDLQGAIPLQLPPGVDLGSLQAPSSRDNEFVVAVEEFGVTIVHPASETRIRVFEEEHRYKPEEWTYESQKYPKETPWISYQLIAPEADKPGEVLIAVGPGAFVEVEEPAPFEGAKEWQLVDWQPRMGGRFNVTIVEMPDNTLVPLPNDDIDVATLLKAGGKMHYPDKHVWRGAMSYQQYVANIGMLIADLLFTAIPMVGELVEAASLASEAAAFAPDLEAAAGGLESGLESTATAGVEDVGASPVSAEPPARPPLGEAGPEEAGVGEAEGTPEAGAGKPHEGGTIDEDTIRAEGLAEDTFEHEGHTYQTLKDGRVVRCSKICSDLETLYGDLFERYPHLNDELANVARLRGRAAGQRAAQLSDRMEEVARFDQMSTRDLKAVIESGELETTAEEDAGYILFRRRRGQLSFEQWVFKSRMEYGSYVYRLVDEQGNVLKWGITENPFARIAGYRASGELDFFEMQVMGGPYARPQALAGETFEAGEIGETGVNVRANTMAEMGGGEWYGETEIPNIPPGTQPLVRIRR